MTDNTMTLSKGQAMMYKKLTKDLTSQIELKTGVNSAALEG